MDFLLIDDYQDNVFVDLIEAGKDVYYYVQ